MYRLYLVTNLRNGKKYVGITKYSLRRRWLQHQQAARNPNAYGGMMQAIRKYGAEAFTIEQIGQSDDWEVLRRMEQEAIQTYNTYAPHGQGYNLTLGGDGTLGAPVSDAERQRRAERARGKRRTLESRQRQSESLKRAFAEGRKPKGFTSEAHREAFFAASKASHIVGWQPSEETRQIWRRQRTGRKASPETRAKMSAAHTGIKVPSRGRKGRAPRNKGRSLQKEPADE